MTFNKRPTLCVECGPDVSIDEDGCCRACGNGAVGSWLDHHGTRLAQLELTEEERYVLRLVRDYVWRMDLDWPAREPLTDTTIRLLERLAGGAK